MDDNYNSIELNMNIFVYSILEIKLSQTVLLRKKLSEIITCCIALARAGI